MAIAGGLYAFLVVPRLLPDTEGTRTGKRRNTQFITEIPSRPGASAGRRSDCRGHVPQTDQHDGAHASGAVRQDFLPPFDDITLRPGDTLIVAATRDTLTKAIRAWNMLDDHAGTVIDEEDTDANFILCESLVATRLAPCEQRDRSGRLHGPAQRADPRRRAPQPHAPPAFVRAAPRSGATCCSSPGEPRALEQMRGLQDLVVLEWSAAEVKPTGRTGRAWAIFVANHTGHCQRGWCRQLSPPSPAPSP